ncbi:MAG: acyloxyacyl hydrolase [Bacteroidia bacterium]
MRTNCVLIFSIIFCVNSLFSQNGLTSHPDWFIKPYVYSGIVIQHRSALSNLIKGYPRSYELSIGKPTLGNKLWHLENNKPDIGVNLTLMDYANPSQLGYGIVVAPFADIPLKEKATKARFHMRLSWGLAYMTKHFDVKTNQKNGAIGSKFNSYVQFKWYWHLPISPSVRLEPGFMFSHVSNARAKSPNLGLNIIGVGLGVHFTKKGNPVNVEKVDSNTRVRSRHEFVVINGYGINDAEVYGRKYLTSSLAMSYHFNKRNTHKFGIGFDVYYEENYVKDLDVEGITERTLIDELRYGPKLAYSYNLGRVSFPVEFGVYLRQLANPDGMFFHRIGVRYYAANNLIASVGLRTHWAVAYCFEFGIGYRFNLKKK